jgi:flagellar hook-length control protein FliK
MTVMLSATGGTGPAIEPATDGGSATDSGSGETFAALLAHTSEGAATNAAGQPAAGESSATPAQAGRSGKHDGEHGIDEQQPADPAQLLAELLPMLAGQPAVVGTFTPAAQAGPGPAGASGQAVAGLAVAGTAVVGLAVAGTVGQPMSAEPVPAGVAPAASVDQPSTAGAAKPVAGSARSEAQPELAQLASAPAGAHSGAAVSADAPPAVLPGRVAVGRATAASAPGTQPAPELSSAEPAPASPAPSNPAPSNAQPLSAQPSSPAPSSPAASSSQPSTSQPSSPALMNAQPSSPAPSSPAPSSPAPSDLPVAAGSQASGLVGAEGVLAGLATASAPSTDPAAQAPPQRIDAPDRPSAAGPTGRTTGNHLSRAGATAAGAADPSHAGPQNQVGAEPALGTVQPGSPAQLASVQPQIQPTSSAQPVPQSQAAPAVPQPVAHQLAGPLLHLRAGGDGNHSLLIALHPAELGPVNLHVRLTGDSMTIQLASTSQSAHDLLRDALPQLHQELQAAGLSSAGLSLELTGQGAGDSAGFQPQSHTEPHRPSAEPPPGKPEARQRRTESGLDRWL